MKTSKRKRNSWIMCMVFVALSVAFPGGLPAQTAAATSSAAGNSMQWNVQVDRVDPGALDLAYSFQFAIYENLLEELNKTKQFKQVYRDGDRNAGEVPNLLFLKTTVEKYTPGSETRRAVTTVSGSTKLTVRCRLVTREGKVVLERTVNGDVRFFGSNLKVTHGLARNIAKVLKHSSWSGSEQPTAVLAGPIQTARSGPA
jgi:hypothetical protein